MNGIFAGSQIAGFRDFCGMNFSGFWDLYGINPRFFIPKNHQITGFLIPQKSRGLIPSLRLKYVEILVHFLEAFLAIYRNFPCQKSGSVRKCTRSTQIFFASPPETPCPKNQLFSYFRPDRFKNLIFSIKLGGCGSNEGLTVSLG